MDRLFSWLFVLLAWFFAAWLTKRLAQQRKQLNRLRTSGLRTKGVVTGHRFTGGDDGAYILQVVFPTQRGQQQETETQASHSSREFPKVTQVAVMYDAVNPADCFVDTYVERGLGYFFAFISWVIDLGSLVFVVLGISLEKMAT